jgi:pseudaminic acid biosynthesis-associated methylase
LRSEQEKFWASTKWSKDYINRNKDVSLLQSNIAFFSKVLASTDAKLDSIFEIGTNIGLNLAALSILTPSSNLYGIEISKQAFEILKKEPFGTNVVNGSIIDYENLSDKYDLVFTKGVLIHINPELLEMVYEKMFLLSNKYILIAEYYNPNPVSIPYRGLDNVLFKRDFCNEMMKRFPSLSLVNYGFVYRYDNYFPQDDITWFLLEKNE